MLQSIPLGEPYDTHTRVLSLQLFPVLNWSKFHSAPTAYSFSQLQTRLLNTTMLAFYRGFISSQITKHETSQGHRKKVSY